MKAGLATIALRQLDVFEAVDLAAEAGFDGVEIWGRAPHTPDVFDEKHTLAIRERVLGHGMEAAILGSYVNSAAADFQERALTAIRVAGTLGSGIIRVWAGDKEPAAATDEDWTKSAANLKWMADRAADKGVTLAMEMHGGTLALSPEGTLRLVELARAGNLKLNYQVNDPGSADLERSVRLVGPHVVMVHAQNCVRSPEGNPHPWERSLIQDGLVDYARLLKLLRPYGFDGYVEVEFLKGDPDKDGMIEAMRKDAAFLRKITVEASEQ
ncbi:MAG: sugar phosphate isomerase/epimerase family protein [Armatimonadota bacterium]|nr:sugar phosphate isomerase/epimerase family protein [Armatimonadota bacterium]